MFAIYGFCRAVDDIADGGGSRDERLRELARWRAEIVALYGGAPTTRVGDLVEPMRRFDLRREDFLSIIDGVEMDVRAVIVAPDASTLDAYCDRVACAVGRLSVRIFRLRGPDGIRLAAELGRALQLTNILRDLDEDAARGRLYLPREALLDAGIDPSGAAAVLAHPALDTACRAVAARARAHFLEADEILSKYPLRITVAPLLMAKAYRHILDRLIEQGWAPPRHRVTVGHLRVLWMLAQHELHR
ncbi:MAG TPA: squalene/phytoene synthase family protein [Casimicrobiaceae bacterium]